MKSLEEYLSEHSLNYKSPAIVMGSAPTVKTVGKLSFSGVRIGVGDMPVRAKNLGPYDYWVTANSYYPLPWISKNAKDIANSKAITLIASMVGQHAMIPQDEILTVMKQVANSDQLLIYNQKHFQNKPCAPEGLCCAISRELVSGPSIQELLGKLNNSVSAAYGQGSTVALHGYALAVLLKANPIFIAGVELPVKYKDYRAYKNIFRPGERIHSKLKRLLRDYLFASKHRDTDFGLAGQNSILEDFKCIAEIASSIGIKTYSLSRTSPLNSIPEINFINFDELPNASTAINN